MYTGRVARVSHVEYAPRALLRSQKGTDRQTDRRTSDRYITLTARRGQRNEKAISKPNDVYVGL